MRKKLFATAFLIAFVFVAKAQSGVVLLTEEYTVSAPYTTTVHVTLANGTITSTPITSDYTDTPQHDVDLNNIINGIVNQGYKITHVQHGFNNFGTATNKAVRRIFFGVP